MISTIDDYSLVVMGCVDILMAPAMNARDLGSASFAVHEVDGLPDTAAPGVWPNAERASEQVTGFDRVLAGVAELGKIQHLILAQRSGDLLDGFGENRLASLEVNQRELAG